MAHITHNDEAVLDCLLGRDNFRARVREQILNAQPPKAIAIHGTWGTGKTSMLKQLYRELGGEHGLTDEEKKKTKPLSKEEHPQVLKVSPVWFEAWQYQHEPNILAAMLKEIRDQLSLIAKVGNLAKNAMVVGALSVFQSIEFSFNVFGAKFGVKGFGKNFTENVKARDEEFMSTPLDSVTFKKLLKEAIDQLLNFDKIAAFYQKAKSKAKKLIDEGSLSFIDKNAPDTKTKAVIFIDDLDRCEPEAVLKILESIKVYLNLENCVFVLGMDMKAVEESVAHKYEKLFERTDDEHKMLKNRARLYLEKICQDVFLLPIVQQETRIEYLDKLLEANRKGLNKALRDSIQVLCVKYNFLPPFPRSIKIFANVILTHCNHEHIQKLISMKKDGGYNLKLFILLAYLYAFHYEIYQHVFLKDGEYLFFDYYLLDYCENPPVKNSEEQKALHPLLKNLILPSRYNPEKAASIMEASNTAYSYKPEFPHESLRQVFWIQKLVIDIKELGEERFPLLKELQF